MPDTQFHVLFAGGDTPGRAMAGYAIAEALADRWHNAQAKFYDWDFGTGTVRTLAIDPHMVSWHSARNAGQHPSVIRRVGRAMAASRAAARYLRRNQVSVVVALGGRAAVQLARAAAAVRLPLVVLEADCQPSATTRRIERYAARVCTQFRETARQLKDPSRAMHTGLPVRQSLCRLAKCRSPAPTSMRRLLVWGDDRASAVLDEVIPRAIYKLRFALDGWEVVHRAGEKPAATAELYRKFAVAASVCGPLVNTPRVLADSDLVVTCPDGTTLAEMTTAGLPALLVPRAPVASDTQRANAKAMVAAGAAAWIDPSGSARRFDDRIAAALRRLVSGDHHLATMRAAVSQLAKPHAAEHVARLVAELASRRDAWPTGHWDAA